MISTDIFDKVQDFTPKTKILHQDNRIYINLEINWRSHSGRRKYQQKIRYLFIKYQVDKGWFKIICFTTEEVVIGHYTNLLKYTLFKRFLALILNRPVKLSIEPMFDIPQENHMQVIFCSNLQ